MSPVSLLLYFVLPLYVRATCYVSQTETIRRDVISVVAQTSLAGCKILCNADANCQATLLNTAGTSCILLGAQIVDPTTNTCPAPFDCYVKTEDNCVDIPQGPIGDGYTPGECSRASDVIGDLVTNVTAPPCGTPSTMQRRIVIDAIQHDGTHITIENYNVALAMWDRSIGSWYIDLQDTPNGEKYYFKAAKCVLAPITALTPNCECASLPTEPADVGYSNPKAPIMNTDPCCTQTWVQMAYLRVTGATTFESTERVISCTMGVWMMIRTGATYNTYTLKAATCLDYP